MPPTIEELQAQVATLTADNVALKAQVVELQLQCDDDAEWERRDLAARYMQAAMSNPMLVEHNPKDHLHDAVYYANIMQELLNADTQPAFALVKPQKLPVGHGG